MSELHFWKIGKPLASAAVHFGDPHQVDKWRRANSSGSIDAHEILLFADLFARIETGEIAAFGFRTEPTVSDGPVRIPGHSFEPRPQLELARENRMRASGYAYERICVLHSQELVGNQAEKPIPANSTGRRSTYDKSKVVIQRLFQTESNRSKPAAKLHPDFEKEFQLQFPSDQWEIAAPSERTLRDHLKRYRQELEETAPA